MFTATPQRKRARPDQLLHNVSARDTPIQGTLRMGNNAVNNDDNNIITRCPSSSEGNSTVMVSPFFDQKNYEGGMHTSSSSPMNTKLETLIEGTPSEELPDNNCIEQLQQHQLQQIPLSQTSLVSTAYSADNHVSNIYNDSTIHNNNFDGSNFDATQPPMKRVKMQHHGEIGQAMQVQEDFVPHVKNHVSKSQRHPQPTKSSLIEKLMEGGNNAMTTTTKRNDTSCSNAVYCHVCGGQGDGAIQQGDLKNDCSSNNSNTSRGNRSIASYFKVTKKQPPTSGKIPPQSSQPNSKKASSQHMTATSTANNDIPHLPLCRYCDRPTCSKPSCTKQCEECQQNFCSFCCKVNYDGMYEKTVCFECDELLMLSHCCDRMDLS